MNQPERRVLTIEGRRTLVVERRPPIPGSLQLLLEGGRDSTGRTWQPLRAVVRNPLRLRGARAACEMREHRLADWLEGFHTGSDAIARYLRVLACQDCGAICIRDASFDHLDKLPTGGQALRRKNHVIGWYSGSRRNQRVYS